MRALLPGLALALFLAGPAAALTITSNPNLAIPDGLGPTAPALDTIDLTGVFAPGSSVTSLEISVSIDHTWVGDLAIELIADDGTEIQLVARAGSAAGDEATEAPFGDGSNLSSLEPILFTDAGTASAETLGAGIPGGGTIPAGSYTPDADGWNTDFNTFAEFVGFPTDGIWTLRVGDYAGFDTGTLVSWSMIVSAQAPIPEPGSALLVLFGLGLLAVASRRRVRRLHTAR